MMMIMMHNDELMMMIIHIEDADSDENKDLEMIMMIHNNHDTMMARKHLRLLLKNC